uniref:Col_cuticle_N domain-containing protein n=2 Tax=Strongyloides stercoralis TaxID=6248 RepID=A0A0K0ESB7_STRER
MLYSDIFYLHIKMNYKIAVFTFSIFIMSMIITYGTSQAISTTIRINVNPSTKMPSYGGNNNTQNNSTISGGSGSLTTKTVATSVTTQKITTSTKGVGISSLSVAVVSIVLFIIYPSITFYYF